MAGFRAAPFVCVFDGQSLNFTPTLSDNYPIRLMAQLGFPTPVTIWVGGIGWADLATDGAGYQSLTTRGGNYSDAGLVTSYMMCGGTSDVLAAVPAADIYGYMGDLAAEARSLGYDKVLASTITPFTGFTGPQEAIRDAANALILADASTYFDGVADFDGTPGLSDPSNTTYYSDGLHFTAAAAQIAADTMQPVLLGALGFDV